MKRAGIIVFVAMFILLSVKVSLAAESVVNFEKNGFKTTLAKAAEMNKLVLVDFYSDT